MRRQLQSTPVTGYYQFFSQIRQRVNVALHEEGDTRQPTMNTTTNSADLVTDHSDGASATNSASVDSSVQQISNLYDREVTKWSSVDVQHWVEEQCQKFELKKTITQKFQMNGQALVLLSKHDFLRRLPDGGEILFYALRRLIREPNTSQSGRTDRNERKSGSSRSNPRIVELTSDTDESSDDKSAPNSPKPIVEEPDDPPVLHKSESDTTHGNHQRQNYSRSFLYNNSYVHQPVFTMPTNAFYQPQQVFTNSFVYAQPNHQSHPQMSQQQYFHQQHFLNQYHQMMAAQGILIEMIDHETANNLVSNGVGRPSNDSSSYNVAFNPTDQLYLVTTNGQRYVVNEEQIRQYVIEIQQNHPQQQQQQQQYFQQPPQDNNHYTL